MPIRDEVAQAAVINAAWLERMRSAKPHLLRELFTMFLADEPKRLTALAEALAAGDLEQMRYHAHSLKGAAATMGMERLRDACKIFEQLAAQTETTELANGLAAIRAEAENVFSLMRRDLSLE